MVSRDFISIWDVFLEFTGLFGGSIAGMFFLGIFTTKGNSSGAILGIIISILILYFVKYNTDIHILLYGAISLLSSFIFGYLGSYFLPGKRQIQGLTIYTKN